MRKPVSDLDVEALVEEQRPRPGTVLLAIKGDADLHVAPYLQERMAAAISDGATLLVLDLSDSTLVDSMTLGVLLGAAKRLRGVGGQLRLVVPQTEIRRILEITLLDRVFAIYETGEEALAATAEPGEP